MTREFTIANLSLQPCEAGKGTVIEYVNPSAEEKEYLENTWSISPHNMSSALDADEIGRFEWEEDHAAMIFKVPRNYSTEDTFLFKVSSVGIFLYPDKLVLIHQQEDNSLMETRQKMKLNNINDGLLKLLNSSVNHFLGHLKVIGMLFDSLEQKVSTFMANDYLLNMFNIEKSLIYYLNAINSNARLMQKIKNSAAKIGLGDQQQELLDDISIENQQCGKQAEIYSTILSSLMDAQNSIVNNNLNTLIKRLTIINVVFMPLNLIAGIGGMSEFSIWTGALPWWTSYPLLAAGLGLLSLLTYNVIKRFNNTTRPAKKKKPRRTSLQRP